MPDRPREWIFETTVLSAFALVERLDLLERRYTEHAHWCLEVQGEVLDGFALHPSLGAIVMPWLGTPIQSLAVGKIERIRQRLGGGPLDTRHLGEAATIVVAKDSDWIVATDDEDATRVAVSEGLRTISTPSILRACVSDGQLLADDAVDLLDEMIDVHGRRLPRLDLDYFGGP